MDKDVRGDLFDAIANAIYEWDNGTPTAPDVEMHIFNAAIHRVEARLIPEAHVAVPARDLHELLADIEWDDINRATPEYREAVERLAVIDYEYAQTSIATLLPLTDRERQDAAPPAPEAIIKTWIELEREPPAPETCPTCGGKEVAMPAKMMVHKPNCRAAYEPPAAYGTGSTDADGGEG